MDSQTKLVRRIDRATTFIILLTVFLIPLVFNPAAANLFDLNKNAFLAVSVGLLLILFSFRNLTSKSFRLTITPFTAPLALLTLAFFVSSFGAVPQMIESFITTTSTALFLFLFFLLASTHKPSRTMPDLILKAIIASGLVLSLAAIAETIGFGPSRLISLLMGTPTQQGVFISPAGSAVVLISFLIPTLIINLILAIEKKAAAEKSLLFITAAVITASLVISAFNILPGKPNTPVFLPFTTSWQVAVENIKEPKNFLIGVGSSRYIAAFSKNKEASFNQTPTWNTRFNAARNYPLHVFTTLGLVGFAFWLLLLVSIGKVAKTHKALSDSAKISLIGLATVLIIILIIPSNLILQALFIFLLAALALELKRDKSPGTSELMLKLFAAKMIDTKHYEDKEPGKLRTELLPIIIGVPSIILVLGLFYGTYRVIAADVKFRSSLSAAASNDGTGTYNLQREAVSLNPFVSNYHRSYANTNLAIANSLSNSGETLSDQDRANVTQLIRQSIREGRNAVLINPHDPANWETLAGIYRNLINVADGALQWTQASYAEAINRDPNSPRLRIELGGIFLQLKDYGTAIQLFTQAASLKPDWANAHYNLANAYAANGELQRAIASYDTVLSLVDPTSADYTQALQEQNLLKSQLGQETTTREPQTSELTPPQPLPSPLPEDQQIQLPEAESAPPSREEIEQTGFGAVANPSPTPLASPSPSPETGSPAPESSPTP